MITSFFKVSKPYHYVLFLLGLTVVFLHFYHQTYVIKAIGFLEIIIEIFITISFSLFRSFHHYKEQFNSK